jgi:hypothetical protein
MKLFGVMAEFATLDDLVAGIEEARRRGYRKMDAYTPSPSRDVTNALQLPPSKLPLITLIGGLVGAVFGYGLQYWGAVFDYPLNVGGRPLHSWAYFVPATSMSAMLFAALAAVFGMFALNRLPALYHPVFNEPRLSLASGNAFFLCVETTDAKFDREALSAMFNELEAVHVAEVPE